jgi:hypothetical protein
MMPKKYFIIAIPEMKYHDGNDFIFDTLPFFKSLGYKVINTRKYGKLASFFYEILLFFALGYKAEILTTWPGFPKITINDKFYLNYLRIYVYLFFAKIKKWDCTILPIDMHLILAKSRISTKLFKIHSFIEDKVYENSNRIIACGDVLNNLFKEKFPNVTVQLMDMYDQVLPEYKAIEKKYNSQKIEIVILGNLLRMADEIAELPKADNITYKVIGKNGSLLEELNRDDINYIGMVPDEDLLPTLGKSDFGLILYSKNIEEYFSYNIAGKVTSYLLAGLPIVGLERYSSMASLIKKKKLGFVYNNISELPLLPKSCSVNEYEAIRLNCIEQANIIRGFGHYKTCFTN